MNFPFIEQLFRQLLPLSLLLLGAGLVLTALLYLLRFRRRGLAAQYAAWQEEGEQVDETLHDTLHRPQAGEGTAYPRISVVVPTCNQADELAYLLPRLLKQRYEGRLEVIVADQLSEDNTVQLVQQLQQKNPRLRYTSVPPTSRHIEPRKLAITLGVKAAHSEWVIVINPDTHPDTLTWVQHFSENLTENVDFVQAYYNYEDDNSLAVRRAILERVETFNRRLAAFRGNVVLGAETANFAVRRNWFLERQGFADSLPLPFGEESIFAARHAEAERTALLLSVHTRLTESTPENAEFRRRRMLGMEIRHHFPWRARKFAWLEALASVLNYAFWLTGLLALAAALWQTVEQPALHALLAGEVAPQEVATPFYLSPALYVLFACLAEWALYVWLSVRGLRHSLKAVGERRMGAYILLFDLTQPFYVAVAQVLRSFHSRSFVRHYLQRSK